VREFLELGWRRKERTEEVEEGGRDRGVAEEREDMEERMGEQEEER